MSFPRALVLFFRRLLPLAAPLAFGACGGNVIVDGPEACSAGLVVCSGECVDLATDQDHCGSCEHACAGGICSIGVCIGGVGGGNVGGGSAGSSNVGGGGPVCPPGLSFCDGGCFNLQNDTQHCGGCDSICEPGAVCAGGFCQILGCASCAEAITSPPGSVNICPESEAIYKSLFNCTCIGNCVFQCSDNVCSGTNITPECQGCVVGDDDGGCGKEYAECSNDF